jgi:hypothetical protein
MLRYKIGHSKKEKKNRASQIKGSSFILGFTLLNIQDSASLAK